MFKISVMYPNRPGTHGDIDYYVHKLMKPVQELMQPEGLVKIAADKGISAPGRPAPYHRIGQLTFDDPAGYDRSIQKHTRQGRGDIPNFTDVTPIRQVSEVVA